MKKEKSVRGKVVVCAFVLSILVLVFAGIMPVAASMTWYVDDSGGADFTSIQWAVDNATAGDTIIVRDGTYVENVKVSTDHLTIKSENGADSTIVQGSVLSSEPVFKMTTDYVNISGFKTTGSTSWGSVLLYENHNSTVENIVASGNKAGIQIHYSSNHTIRKNIIRENNGGIYLSHSSNNNITENTIEDNPNRAVFLSYSNNNRIKENTVSDAKEGIYLSTSSHNKVSGNIAKDNTGSGIRLSAGSNHNNIKDNIANNNADGIYLDHSNNNEIKENIVNHNINGIHLYAYSNDNNITENTIKNNNNYGIYVRLYSENNEISRNTAEDNMMGIRFYKANNNIINLNNFISNINNAGTYNSINTWNSPNQITYTYLGNTHTNYLGNYWDDYTDIDSNNDGIWDKHYAIDSDNDYYPLVEPFENYDVSQQGKIAFASSRDGNQEVYVINADGSDHPINLTNFPDADDGDPTWSPDGKQIAFSSDRSGNWKTYVMDADDGSNQVCLTEDVYDAWGPAWSPDGKEIAFACQLSSDDNFEIYTMDIQSKALTQVTDNSDTDSHPAWSPNSHKIVFTSTRDGNHELYVADLLAGTKTRLTDEPAYDDYPEWSPDGSMIVFVSERDGNQEIYSMNIASKAITRLTYNEHTDKHAQYSSDGQKIIFASDRDGGGDLDVYVMNVGGTSIACLVDWEGDETHPTWSPSSAPDKPPTCAIELQKNGIPIANINVGEFFDIYVGDSTDDQSIKEVRFSSDDAQDDNPTGEWTDWYDWDTSSGDWNAVNKIKAWSFATGGAKEVWAEVKDGDGQADKCSANIYANQLPIAKPVITSPLEITPIKDIYYVGDTIRAEFTIKNEGSASITFDILTVGGRLNGECPIAGCPDFTHKSLTLQPGESYHYEGSLTLHPGNYQFFIAYYIENPTPDEKKLLDENNWNTCVDLGEGLTPADRIKNIIALEEEISSPDTVSELRDRINHNLQRQVKYPPYLPDPNSFQSAVATVWASFTSWITQTHLTEKYDEFYQTGIDYDCLRFKALKDARDSLDRGDIVSAKKYLQKSYTYEKLSVMSFGAAAEVFENNLEAGGILAEGITDGCEASVKFGLGVTNPEAAKAADYVYIGVDYAVDHALLGEEQAIKNAIVNAVVTTTFNEIKFGDLGDRTIADYTENRIGKVTFPMLQEAFQNNEPLQFALSKIIKECGVGIEEAVAEDIAMHILNELEQAVDFKQIEAKSPVEVQVYGSHGDVTGLLSGTVEHRIPRSLYCKGTVTILYPLDSYRYDISGTDEGTYGLDITSVENGKATTFTATDIPTTTGAIHEYTINWDALSQGEEGVTVLVDSDGDGTFEYIFTADNELTQEEFLSGTDGEPIPEFTTIAIPVAIVLGLIFIISRRKRKR